MTVGRATNIAASILHLPRSIIITL